MTLNFKNRYGWLSLSLVSDVRPVSDIHGADIDGRHKFSLDLAEQIVLITDNRGIQICPVKEGAIWLCYVIAHASPSTAAVARVEAINYVGPNPAQEIRRLAS